MTKNQRRFGPSALVVELNDLAVQAAHPERGDLLDGDLTSLIERNFTLTSDQQAGVERLRADEDGVELLRRLILEAAQDGANGQFVVVHQPAPNSRLGYVHTLRYERTNAAAPDADRPSRELSATEVSTIGIAHCDADCRNWGWGLQR
ncbi:hypothetical protein QQG74_03025 [Micromonospora sp. FIMYZ51]|uniref:hypothetical protein n=1 Tax=Micromonospora sp. FIMYZ51 TaxID=3051832 RepID=UPI0031200FAD